jgi:hypothetical protein
MERSRRNGFYARVEGESDLVDRAIAEVKSGGGGT